MEIWILDYITIIKLDKLFTNAKAKLHENIMTRFNVMTAHLHMLVRRVNFLKLGFTSTNWILKKNDSKSALIVHCQTYGPTPNFSRSGLLDYVRGHGKRLALESSYIAHDWQCCELQSWLKKDGSVLQSDQII
jgi:hypothetical protein